LQPDFIRILATVITDRYLYIPLLLLLHILAVQVFKQPNNTKRDLCGDGLSHLRRPRMLFGMATFAACGALLHLGMAIFASLLVR